MDVWWWVILLVLLALIGLFMVARRSARTRIDPTEVSIDPSLAARVRELYARGDKVKAVTELRAATGLGISDALVIVDKLGKSNRPGSS
jgi:ribosomal protein L7/L12